MGNSAAKIQCINPRCQAYNLLHKKVCSQCRTPTVRRYLRGIGEGIEAIKVGDLMGERYLLKQPRIFLDTKPGQPPEIPEEIPAQIARYLKLSLYRLNIPQVYGKLTKGTNQATSEIYLLEYSNVQMDIQGELVNKELFPCLTDCWPNATAMRQLNWLWQMACLWQPLCRQGVASSLLNPDLLRINDRIIQLLELKTDESKSTNLKLLGELWSDWVATSSPSISQFLQQLCLDLQQEKITNIEQLLNHLHKGLLLYDKAFERRYTIFTSTDSGPSRDHNEDACYPKPGNLVIAEGEAASLVIVCDGVGGQDGGEIASNLAIETMQEKIKKLSLEQFDSDVKANIQQFKRITSEVNDLISSRNDRENRHERQRMGTTLVMALAHHHEVFLTHVGDSRIYLITPTSCKQLTVDDDLASREVRLGYAFYRDALQYPNGGALVQALGMNPSHNLHPNVQRLIVDEDCILLLCSDGLSDYDRVDQYWQTEIAPIFEEKKDLPTVATKLVQIANEKNGHDNVTVALIYCKVSASDELEILPSRISVSEDTLGSPTVPQVAKNPANAQALTKLGSKYPSSFAVWILSIISILGVLGIFIYWAFPEVRQEINKFIGINNSSNTTHSSPAIAPSVSPTPTTFPPPPTSFLTANLQIGDIFELAEQIMFPYIFSESSQNSSTNKIASSQTIVQVIDKNEEYIDLMICSIPENANQLNLVKPRERAIIRIQELQNIKWKKLDLAQFQSKCAN